MNWGNVQRSTFNIQRSTGAHAPTVHWTSDVVHWTLASASIESRLGIPRTTDLDTAGFLILWGFHSSAPEECNGATVAADRRKRTFQGYGDLSTLRG